MKEIILLFAPWRPLFVVLLVGCTILNNLMYSRHVIAGRTTRDKYGYFQYFWKLSKVGESEGRIAVCLMFVAGFSGAIMICTLLV